MREVLYIEKETMVYTGYKRIKETRVAATQEDNGHIKINRIFIRLHTQRDQQDNHHPNRASIA